MLTIVAATGRCTDVVIDPATSALVSWASTASEDTLEIVVTRLDGHVSQPLPYVAFERERRTSLNTFDAVARIETDVISADTDIAAISVRSRHPLARVAVSTPSHAHRNGEAPRFHVPYEMNVPERSQYLPDFPDERGWCAPAAIAMLLATSGVDRSVDEVARAIYDSAYKGTGNWAFAVAYAGSQGLLGVAAYLRDLHAIERFLAARIPIALSVAWGHGELPGAPLDASAGHLLVARGFDAHGDPIVNDPAQPLVRHVYPRAAFERCWLEHGAVALIVTPPDVLDTVVDCANA